MYDQILLPTDGSEGMSRVVEHAGELARVHDASVHALFVVDTASLSTMPMDASLDGVHGLMHDEGTRAMEEVARILPEDVPVERSTREGSPAREIVDVAEADDCDVIVMGTHGRGGLNRLLLGSVAEHVVRQAPVPVVTVSVGPETEAELSLQQAEQ